MSRNVGTAARRPSPTPCKTPAVMGSQLASIDSVPLRDILRFMDHESDNFTAEILLKQLGADYGDNGTTASGLSRARKTKGMTVSP